MSRVTLLAFTVACLALLAGSAPGMSTFNPITNGGFETGTFAGWTVFNSGSGNWSINDGTFDPPGPGGALAPISGSFDAVSSQGGSGLHILSDSFVVPGGIVSAVLGWSDRIRNHAGVFSDPNQEWRVLIEDAGSGALLHEVFSTNPGDPLQQLGPNHRSFDLTTVMAGLEGQSVRVSFEQQDNLFFFNATLDNARFLITTPEPTAVALFAVGAIGAMGVALRRRKRRA
jgi:hypothetical protein